MALPLLPDPQAVEKLHAALSEFNGLWMELTHVFQDGSKGTHEVWQSEVKMAPRATVQSTSATPEWRKQTAKMESFSMLIRPGCLYTVDEGGYSMKWDGGIMFAKPAALQRPAPVLIPRDRVTAQIVPNGKVPPGILARRERGR